MAENLHGVAMAAGILCVRCEGCGHRAALTKDALPGIHAGNMTPLAQLNLTCTVCRGADVALYVPFDREEARTFIAGGAIEHRRTS